MSIEQLRSIERLRKDMKESSEALTRLGAPGFPPPAIEDVVAFLQHTMWPTIEAAVDEVAQIDECVEDLLNASEDILQPETAELFAALVVAGRAVATELTKRLGPGDAETRKLVSGFLDLATSAEAAIVEITVPEDEDEEDEDEGDEEGKPT